MNYTGTIDRDSLETKVTAEQVQRLYGVTRRQLYYALDNGLIRAVKFGRTWVIDIRDLPETWPTLAT